MTYKTAVRLLGLGATCSVASLATCVPGLAQQAPSSGTSAPATNLGTMVVAPENAPDTSTVAQRLRIQRKALNLNFSSTPAAPPNPGNSVGARPKAAGPAIKRLPPRPLHVSPPHYPSRALAKHLNGTVTVAFTIRADGSTSDIRIKESQPPGVFNYAARKAVSHWLFHPATANGVPVATRVRQTLVFRPPAGARSPVPQQPAPQAGAVGRHPADSVPSNIHPTHLVAPQYPQQAYRSRVGGSVTVSFMVAPNGHTRDIRVVTSRPRHIFDNAAVEAVQRWRFKPVAKPTRVVQTIRFTPP